MRVDVGEQGLDEQQLFRRRGLAAQPFQLFADGLEGALPGKAPGAVPADGPVVREPECVDDLQEQADQPPAHAFADVRVVQEGFSRGRSSGRVCRRSSVIASLICRFRSPIWRGWDWVATGCHS